MAAIFPLIYPEEPLFSAIARHAESMAFPDDASLRRDLYGTHMARPDAPIPGALALLARHLPPGHPHTPWSILRDHSPLPYFLPFWSRRTQRSYVPKLWTTWPEANCTW